MSINIGNLVSYPVPITELTDVVRGDASLSKQYAIGEKYDGSPVREGDAGYDNNAKYYSEQMSTIADTKYDDVQVQDGYLVFYANGVEMKRIIYSGGGGGGGGGGGDTKITLTNTSGFLSTTVAIDTDCILSFNWSSTLDGEPTGDGSLLLRVSGSLKRSTTISQGDVSINIKDYVNPGRQSVVIVVMDSYGNSRAINFTINVVSISMTSNFNDGIAYSASIPFTYTPIGTTAKTVYFILDGVQVGTEIVTASDERQTYVIPAQSHGSHLLECYCTVTIDEEVITSNHLYFDLICVEAGVDTTIIASNFVQDTAIQYDAITIPYIVYDASGYPYCDVTLSVDGTIIQELSDVDRSRHYWTWTPTVIDNHTLTISSNGVTKTFNIDVEESSIDIQPVTSNMSLYLNAINRSNLEAHPEIWEDEDNGVSCTLTGFNFSSDGWISDDDGAFLRLSGNARVSIPYLLFGQDFKPTGKTIEFEFRTRDILNYSSNIITCFNQGIGLNITAQDVTLKSEQTEIYSQFKEDEHVRVSFVVSSDSNYRLIYCYINGIISNIKSYPYNDDFEQGTPVGITIGSNDATVDIYRIRIYDVDLTRFQMVRNWIADMQNGTTRTYYYNLNNNYDEYNVLKIDKLPAGLPYLIIEGPLPTQKDDKFTIKGEFIDTGDSSRSFTYEGAEIAVQGTSSLNYPRKNYKIKFKGGFKMTDTGNTEPKFSIRPDSVPVSTFTFKADFASSEGANNVELVRYYCDLCPYEIPPQVGETELDIRQGIDGFPIVVFHKESASSDPTFLGKYNFNNDKGTPEVFGFSEGDESWEIRRNGSDNVEFKTADFTSTYFDTQSQTYKPVWTLDFEGRYPDKNQDITKLSEFSTWLSSTYRAAATGDSITPVEYGGITYNHDTADYRLAKFKYELPNYLELESAIFYYLFTEIFLMIDSRAKNAFPSKYDGNQWCWLPYDMDTAIGINNEGELVFGYNLEDTDKINQGQDNVFNGQDSVMWCNLRDAFPAEIKDRYKTIRNKINGMSYESIEQRFEDHQRLWSANIFNEDSWFKYVLPYVNEGQDYLAMCLGSKEEQRKWWLFNRFRYIDSKYNTGDAATNYIEFRSWDIGDKTFNITPYADIYPTVEWGTGNIRSVRGQRNVMSSIEFSEVTDANDRETKIYSADQLMSIGDIGKFHCNRVNVAMATKLQELKVGVDSGTNPNLTELTLGNNSLLTTLHAKNCVNLASSVNVENCTGLVNAYFENTRITGLTLPPDGGILEKLHLPSTIANLTIMNQLFLTDLRFDSTPTNLSTLRLEGVPSELWSDIFWFESEEFHSLLESMVGNKRVRLIGWDLTFSNYSQIEDFLSILDTCKGLDQNGGNVPTAQVTGTIRISLISASQIEYIHSKYPAINVVYDYLALYVNFYTEDGTLLQSVPANPGSIAQYTGPAQTKNVTAQYYFYFDGWSTSIGGELVYTTSVIPVPAGSSSDINCYAHFNAVLRSYTIRFFNGDVKLQENTVYYGDIPVYTGETPIYNGPEVGDWGAFTGWSPAITTVVGPQDYYAQFEYVASLTRSLLTKRIREIDDNTIEVIKAQSLKSCKRLTSINTPLVSKIEGSQMTIASCTSLKSVYMPNLTSIEGTECFRDCNLLNSINLDKLKRLPRMTLMHTALTSISLPEVTSTDNGYAIYYNSELVTVSLPKLTALTYGDISENNKLESIYFGDLKRMITRGVFSGCSSLTSITIATPTLCTLDGIVAFDGCPIANGVGYIYVPTSLYSQYITATNWSTFASQITTITS